MSSSSSSSIPSASASPSSSSSPIPTQSDSASPSPSSAYYFHDDIVSLPKKLLVPCSNTEKSEDDDLFRDCEWECQCHLTPCICECRCDRYDNWVTSTSISPHREMEWRTLIDPKLDSFLLSLLIQWGKVQRRPCDSKDLLCVDGWVIGSSEIIKRTNPRLFTPEGIKIPCPHCWSGKISYLFILCREPSWKPYWHINAELAASSSIYISGDYSAVRKHEEKDREKIEKWSFLRNYCQCKSNPPCGESCQCHPNEVLLSEKDKEWEKIRRKMNMDHRSNNNRDNGQNYYFIVDMTCELFEEKNKKYVGSCWSPLWYRAYDIFGNPEENAHHENYDNEESDCDDPRGDVQWTVHEALKAHCLSLVLEKLNVTTTKKCHSECNGRMCRGCGGVSLRHPLMFGCCSTKVFCDGCYSGQASYIVFLIMRYTLHPHYIKFAREMVKIKRERMLQMGINWDEKHKETQKDEAK